MQPQSFVTMGDSGVARRAALWLGLTIPFLGLPVGWIFMMIEDRNKQAVGRRCVAWSLVGLLIHLVLTYLLFQSVVPYVKLFTSIIGNAGKHSAGSGGSLPGLDGQ